MPQTAHKIGSIFDTGWKIISVLIVIISGVVSVVMAWIQIETNTQDIIEAKKEFSREIVIQEDRNEKRFMRSTEWNKERKEQLKELEERVRQLEISQAKMSK